MGDPRYPSVGSPHTIRASRHILILRARLIAPRRAACRAPFETPSATAEAETAPAHQQLEVLASAPRKLAMQATRSGWKCTFPLSNLSHFRDGADQAASGPPARQSKRTDSHASSKACRASRATRADPARTRPTRQPAGPLPRRPGHGHHAWPGRGRGLSCGPVHARFHPRVLRQRRCSR